MTENDRLTAEDHVGAIKAALSIADFALLPGLDPAPNAKKVSDWLR